jgi:hypothetical protein
MRAGVAQGAIVSPVLFSLYVDHIHTPSRHIGLALYAEDMAFIATSRKPLLLVCYLETCLDRLQHWLPDWMIAISVSRRTEVLFSRTARRIQKRRPLQFFWVPIQCVEAARCLGVTRITQLTWMTYVGQVGWKAVQWLGVLGPHFYQKRRAAL